MSAYVKLQAFRQIPGGLTASYQTVHVGGVDYSLPMPFTEVADPVVVAPLMEVSEDGRSVSLRMDRWRVLNLDRNLQLPLHLADMATAVRAARGFERDTGISWHSSETDLSAWVLAWLEQERTRTGGDR